MIADRRIRTGELIEVPTVDPTVGPIEVPTGGLTAAQTAMVVMIAEGDAAIAVAGTRRGKDRVAKVAAEGSDGVVPSVSAGRYPRIAHPT